MNATMSLTNQMQKQGSLQGMLSCEQRSVRRGCDVTGSDFVSSDCGFRNACLDSNVGLSAREYHDYQSTGKQASPATETPAFNALPDSFANEKNEKIVNSIKSIISVTRKNWAGPSGFTEQCGMVRMK